MSYCSSNPNYDDTGAQCDDTYSSLSGIDFCGLAGGQGNMMSNYQQGLMARTPSYCNQVDNYAPISAMYSATQIPAIALLQYQPVTGKIFDNRYVNIAMTTDGKTRVPKVGVQSPYDQHLANKASQGAARAMQNKVAAQQMAKREGFYMNPNVHATVN
jgi:hypothetical protein